MCKNIHNIKIATKAKIKGVQSICTRHGQVASAIKMPNIDTVRVSLISINNIDLFSLNIYSVLFKSNFETILFP